MNKILVCITIQENSKRLIRKGHELAESSMGSLHILHIRKGETIFETPDSAELLEELFSFGSQLGGEVHFLCSDDVLGSIQSFINENGISHLVIGEAPVGLTLPSTICNTLTANLKNVQIHVLPRVE